jgi:hypothetical protein
MPDQGDVDVRAGLGHPPDAFDARDEGCPRSAVALVDVQIVDACGIDSYGQLARTGCGHVDVAEMEILGSTLDAQVFSSRRASTKPNSSGTGSHPQRMSQ